MVLIYSIVIQVVLIVSSTSVFLSFLFLSVEWGAYGPAGKSGIGGRNGGKGGKGRKGRKGGRGQGWG